MATTYYHTVNGKIRGQTTAGVRTDYLTDALGSVVATVDSSAAVVNTYRYKPSGERLAKTGVGADPRFGWTGDTGSRRTERSFADQYNSARHYGTRQGQWTTIDPIAAERGHLWPYVYCNGNPTVPTDPSGLSPVHQPRRCGEPKCGDPKSACEKLRQDPEFKDAIGGVVCCDHEAVICLLISVPWPTGIDECALEHERTHLPHCPCTEPGVYPCRPVDRKEQLLGECEAYKAELDCLLERQKRDCRGLDPLRQGYCAIAYLKRICTACKGSDQACGIVGLPLHSHCYTPGLREFCKRLLKK